MMRSSILGASTMLNVLIQHLPLQSLFWTKIWRAFRASDPSIEDNHKTNKILHFKSMVQLEKVKPSSSSSSYIYLLSFSLKACKHITHENMVSSRLFELKKNQSQLMHQINPKRMQNEHMSEMK